MVMRREKPRAPVERETAFGHAQLTARRAWAGEVPDLSDWGAAELDSEPL